jgi:hypothetical protein
VLVDHRIHLENLKAQHAPVVGNNLHRQMRLAIGRAASHPRQSPTVRPCCSYFPVFSSPTATIEAVGNTGNMSSEKAGVGGSTPSLATIIPKDLNVFAPFLQPKVQPKIPHWMVSVSR